MSNQNNQDDDAQSISSKSVKSRAVTMDPHFIGSYNWESMREECHGRTRAKSLMLPEKDAAELPLIHGLNEVPEVDESNQKMYFDDKELIRRKVLPPITHKSSPVTFPSKLPLLMSPENILRKNTNDPAKSGASCLKPIQEHEVEVISIPYDQHHVHHRFSQVEAFRRYAHVRYVSPIDKRLWKEPNELLRSKSFNRY